MWLDIRNKIKTLNRFDIQYFFFILYAFLLPLVKKKLPILVSLLLLSSVLVIRKIQFKKYSLLLLIIPVAFYLLHVIGISYTEDKSAGYFDLQVKLSILFIPLIGLFVSNVIVLKKTVIYKAFVYGNLSAGIYCLLMAFFNSISYLPAGKFLFETSRWPSITEGLSFFETINLRYNYFSYELLSQIHHPSYFSLYLVLSVFIVVYLVRNNIFNLISGISLISFFVLIIWMLGSRAGYLSLIIGTISFILFLIIKYKNLKFGIILFVFTLGFIGFILTNQRIQKNIKEITTVIHTETITKDSDMRIWLWKSGGEIIRENFWSGVGTGDMNNSLRKKYQDYGLDLAYSKTYNVHNQFMDAGIKTGIMGILSLLVLVVVMLQYSIKVKNFLFFYFSLFIGINFLFEVLLSTIAGVSFFVFFYSLFFCSGKH